MNRNSIHGGDGASLIREASRPREDGPIPQAVVVWPFAFASPAPGFGLLNPAGHWNAVGGALIYRLALEKAYESLRPTLYERGRHAAIN